MVPALFKLRDMLLHPPKNSRMGQSDATFRHHLDEVTEAQFKCDVPSHTQNDDLLVKVPSLEQILCRGRFRHPGSYRRIPGLSTVCTRTVPGWFQGNIGIPSVASRGSRALLRVERNWRVCLIEACFLTASTMADARPLFSWELRFS